MHTSTTAPAAAGSGHVVVEGWRQPTRSVHRAPSYPPMESEPSHPRRLAPAAVVGGGGMLRPRLRFGITSTSSTSRLITLSAAAAAVAATVAVGCGEAIVEVADEGEEGEAKAAATKKEKNNEMNIGRESRNYYTSTGRRGWSGAPSSRLAYINWGRFGI